MGLRKYASASNALAEELAALLSVEEVTILANEMSALGLHAWVAWQAKNAGEVEFFVEATPGQRAKKKAWSEPALRRQLVLAGITHCLSAFELLNFLDQHAGMLSPGGSYRDTTSSAGRLYWELMSTAVPHWPTMFEQVVDSPFEE